MKYGKEPRNNGLFATFLRNFYFYLTIFWIAKSLIIYRFTDILLLNKVGLTSNEFTTYPMKKILTFFLLLGTCTGLNGQFSITAVNTDHTIDFNTYDGTVITTTSTAGITSNEWAMFGLYKQDIDFGSDNGDSKDFKGTSDGTGKGGKGIYAFDVSNGVGGANYTLGVEPEDGFFGSDTGIPGGYFTLKIQNNTGQTINTLSADYDIFLYNSEDETNSFDFSHSSDNSSYTSLAALDFDSPTDKDSSPSWVKTQRSTNLLGLSIASGEVYYLRWTGNTDASGKDNGDLMSFDNVVLNANAIPEPSTVAVLMGVVAFGAVVIRRRYAKKE